MTPVGASRRSNVSASVKKRDADTMTGTRSGTGASSATRTKPSATMRPPLMSCMDALLERIDAETLDRVDEDFARALAQLDVGRDDVLDHVGDFPVRHRRADELSQLRVLVGAAPDRD